MIDTYCPCIDRNQVVSKAPVSICSIVGPPTRRFGAKQGRGAGEPSLSSKTVRSIVQPSLSRRFEHVTIPGF